MYYGHRQGDRDKSKIQSYRDDELRKIMKAMQNYPSVIRTQYACALADGDKAEADRQTALFEKTAKTYPYQTEIEAEREAMSYAKIVYQKQ